MATGATNEENRAFLFRLQILIIDGGLLVLRNIMDKKLFTQGVSLGACLRNEKSTITSLRSRGKLSKAEHDILFPSGGIVPTTSDLDITLIICLLRNLKCFGLSNSFKWNVTPISTDVSLEADLWRLKKYRNIMCHILKTTAFQQNDFTTYWNNIEQILIRQTPTVSNIHQKIAYFKTTSLDAEKEKRIQKEIEKWEDYEAKVDRLQEETKKGQEEFNNLKGVVSDLKTGISNVKGEVSYLQEDVSNVNGEVSDMKAEVCNLKSGVSNITEDVSDVNGKVSEMKCEVNDIKDYVSGLECEASNMKVNICNMEGEVSEMKTDVSDVKADIYDMKADVSDVKNAVSKVKGKIVDVKAEVSDLSSKLADMTVDVIDVKGEVSDMKTGVSNIKSKVTDMNEDVSSEVNDIKADVSDLKSEVTVMRAVVYCKVNDLKVDVSELNKKITYMKVDDRSVKGKVSNTKADVKDMNSELFHLKADVSHVKCDISDMKTDVSDVKDEVSDLKFEVTHVKGEVRDMETDVGDVKIVVSDIQANVHYLKNVFDKMKMHQDDKDMMRKYSISIQNEGEKYQELKRYLKDDIIKSYNTRYNKIPLSPLFEEKDTPLESFFIRPEIKEKTSKTRYRMHVSLSNMLKFRRNANREIYLTADAGLGKTTFSKYLAITWCQAHCSEDSDMVYFKKDDLHCMQGFEFVFLVLLRDSYNLCSLDDLIFELILSNLAHSKKYDKSFLQEILNREKCLVILDGLDEWTHPPENPCRKTSRLTPHRSDREKCTVLTTTRPWKLCVLNPSNSNELGKHVELIKFNEISAVKLIERTLQRLKSLNREDSETELERFTNEVNEVIGHMAFVPLLLMYIICSWCDGVQIRNSKCEMYANVVELLLSRMTTKHGELESSRTPIDKTFKWFTGRDHCTKYFPFLIALGRLAYHTLFNENALEFDRSVAEMYLDECNMKISLLSGMLTEHTSKSLTKKFLKYHSPIKQYKSFLQPYS